MIQERPKIMLCHLDDTEYFVIEGEEHIKAMIMDDPFPTPVLCVRFESKAQLTEVLGTGFSTADCWKLKTTVVERLRAEKQLLETRA